MLDYTPLGMFCPHTPMASEHGLEPLKGPRDYDKVKSMIKQAGYAGEKTALMVPIDYVALKALGEVMADTMKRVGFNVDYVDTVTEAGPNLLLAEQTNPQLIQSVLNRVNISVESHRSVGIAVVGHHDCAGNPANKSEQINHLKKSITLLRQKYDQLPVLALWVDKNHDVHEIFSPQEEQSVK